MNQSSLDNLKSLLPEFYQAIGETLIMISVSSAVGIIVGGLLGIWLYTTAHGQIFANRPVHRTLGTLVSFMRSFPFVILMIVVMPLTRAIVGTSFGPLAAKHNHEAAFRPAGGAIAAVPACSASPPRRFVMPEPYRRGRASQRPRLGFHTRV